MSDSTTISLLEELYDNFHRAHERRQELSRSYSMLSLRRSQMATEAEMGKWEEELERVRLELDAATTVADAAYEQYMQEYMRDAD